MSSPRVLFLVLLFLAALTLPGLVVAAIAGNWLLAFAFLWAFLVIFSAAIIYAVIAVRDDTDYINKRNYYINKRNYYSSDENKIGGEHERTQ